MAAKGTLVNVLKETEITMGSALLDQKHRPKFFGSLNFRVACGIAKGLNQTSPGRGLLSAHYQSVAKRGEGKIAR